MQIVPRTEKGKALRVQRRALGKDSEYGKAFTEEVRLYRAPRTGGGGAAPPWASGEAGGPVGSHLPVKTSKAKMWSGLGFTALERMLKAKAQ